MSPSVYSLLILAISFSNRETEPQVFSLIDRNNEPIHVSGHGFRRLFIVLPDTNLPNNWQLAEDLVHPNFGVYWIAPSFSENKKGPIFYRDKNNFFTKAENIYYLYFGEQGTMVEKMQGFPSKSKLLGYALEGFANDHQSTFFLGKDRIQKQTHLTDCGAASTCMVLERIDQPYTLEEVYQYLDKGQGNYCSMLDIYKFFRQKSISAQGVRGKLVNIIQETKPVIVTLNRKHFVVIVAAGSMGVVILDPGVGRKFIKTDAFLKIWNGIYFRIL